jgi:hypothetical protein
MSPCTDLYFRLKFTKYITLHNFRSAYKKIKNTIFGHKFDTIKHCSLKYITLFMGPVILHKDFLCSVHKPAIRTPLIALYTPPPSPLYRLLCAQAQRQLLSAPPSCFARPPIYYPITCAPPICLAHPPVVFFPFFSLDFLVSPRFFFLPKFLARPQFFSLLQTSSAPPPKFLARPRFPIK